MAFTFSLNNLYASQQECLYRWKEQMIANGWVVKSSGDGTGGSFSSSGDVITTFSTSTDGVVGAITNRSAWFRIQSPDTTRELLVYHAPFNVATDSILVRYSPSAKFTGTGDGALSATVAPTATDNFQVLGSQRPISGASGIAFCNSFSGNFRMDFIFGGASENYAFFAGMRQSGGTGAYVGGFLFDRLTNSLGSDPDSTVVWALSGQGSGTLPFRTNSQSFCDGRTYWSYGTAGVAGDDTLNNTYPFGVPVRNTPRADAANAWHIIIPAWMASGANLLNTLGSNPYDGNIDLIEPCYWACTSLTPSSGLGSLGSPAAFGVLKGTSQILKATSTTSGFNPMDTNTALTRVAQSGGFWLLWDGATTPIL